MSVNSFYSRNGSFNNPVLHVSLPYQTSQDIFLDQSSVSDEFLRPEEQSIHQGLNAITEISQPFLSGIISQDG